MATVITSIGSKSEHSGPVNAQITVNASSGSGTPWSGTVTYAGSDPTINVGDILHYKDVYYNCDGYSSCADGPLEVDYLITAIDLSTNILTIRHIRGGTGDSVDPYSNLVEDEATQETAQPYIVRCFSTITTWEAALDTSVGVLYTSGDGAQGECYADSAFTQTGLLTTNTGNGLEGGRVLTVPVGQRHDGTADSGVKVNLSSGGRFKMSYQSSTTGHGTIEWLELDGGDTEQYWDDFGQDWAIIFMAAGGGTSWVGTVSHMLIHGCNNSKVIRGAVLQASSAFSIMHSNIIYDCSGRMGTAAFHGGGNAIVAQNTAYKIGMTSEDHPGYATGVSTNSSSQVTTNNIATGGYILNASSEGTVEDFRETSTGVIGTHNLSGDSTADGSNSVTGESASDLFEDTTEGSEDLHLKSESAALRAGDDLGTGISNAGISAGSSDYGTPINIDIDGRDRDGEGDDWDIGADQCHTCSEAAGGTTNAAFLLLMD